MKKTLDCVALKDEIQARLSRELNGLSPVRQAAAIHAALDRSRSPVGRLWRALREREKTASQKVAEGGSAYGSGVGKG